MPNYEKLVTGAGPETNDVSAQETTTVAHAPISLAPLTLNAAPESKPDASEASAGEGVIKLRATASGFVPKGPIDPESKVLWGNTKGLSEKLGDKTILDRAKGVNVMPLPLLPSAQETDKKIDTVLEAEKAQMSDLWEATLTRSPDIQFVVQKLMPTSNHGHAATVITHMLSAAMFGAMGAANMMMPNMGMYAATSSSGNVLASLIGIQDSKNAKKANLSETEGIMLYTIVRNTADKLVENYRNYKKTLATQQKAVGDFQDLQNMVVAARSGQDATKQVEMEYTLKRAQRDLDETADDLRKYRQSLFDLAGPDAVASLDKQIEEENNRIDAAVGTPDGAAESQGTPEGSTTSNSNQQTAANPENRS